MKMFRLRLAAVLAAPIAFAGIAQADPEPYSYTQGQDEAPALLMYSGVDFTGEVREIYDPIYALPDIQFNDRARSIAVLSGQWEVCEHSDFTGRCVFLRYDVPDLAWFGLSRELSSVRPVLEYTEAEHGLVFTRDQNGYIRYADDERYGYDNYSYGYGASTAIQVYHYGYSPEYRRYGYYDPRLGYDPYGFGWNSGYGNSYYSSSYHRERPPLRGHYGARDAAVTLYVDANDRGASLGTNREIRDLSRYRFNDNVSSIQIRSGRWEVCEHANFGGRCEIVDASVDRLNGLRLNDNISSIRPVDGTGHSDWDGHDRGGRDGDHRGHGDRGDRGGRGDRVGRDGQGTGPQTGLPPALRNVQPVAPAAVSSPGTPAVVAPRPDRRPRDGVTGRRGDPGLSGGPSRRDVGTPDRVRRTPSEPARRVVAVPRTPATPQVRDTPRRDTRPPALRGTGSPQPVSRRPVTPPAPRAVVPATRPAAPVSRPPPPPPRVAAPAPAPVPQPAPAPRPQPQRDTRSPALRSKGRPTRNQD
jgi:hypothetical protein